MSRLFSWRKGNYLQKRLCDLLLQVAKLQQTVQRLHTIMRQAWRSGFRTIFTENEVPWTMATHKKIHSTSAYTLQHYTQNQIWSFNSCKHTQARPARMNSISSTQRIPWKELMLAHIRGTEVSICQPDSKSWELRYEMFPRGCHDLSRAKTPNPLLFFHEGTNDASTRTWAGKCKQNILVSRLSFLPF